jgi:hypothetical protein
MVRITANAFFEDRYFFLLKGQKLQLASIFFKKHVFPVAMYKVFEHQHVDSNTIGGTLIRKSDGLRS